MSIESFISGSLENLNEGRCDIALALVCSCVDATATLQYPDIKQNNKKYKKFLKENMRTITTYGFPGVSVSGIKIKCSNISEIKADTEGYTDIENILYHIIRCSLIHQCQLDERINLVPYTHIGDFEDKFEIPNALIFGLLLSVVLAECNSRLKLDKEYILTLNKKQLNINQLWGKKIIEN
jgi:hypothetical protein